MLPEEEHAESDKFRSHAGHSTSNGAAGVRADRGADGRRAHGIGFGDGQPSYSSLNNQDTASAESMSKDVEVPVRQQVHSSGASSDSWLDRDSKPLPGMFPSRFFR